MEDEKEMAQEDQTQNHSNSGSGGGCGGGARSSKKTKQKKVPQRGLGVAQLEKIRMEEQIKQNAAAILPSPPSTYLPLPIQNFHPSPPPKPDFMTPLSLQHMDANVSSTVPLAKSCGGWPNSSVLARHGNVPKIRSSNEFDFEKERFGLVSGMSFIPFFPYDSNSNNPNWPLPNLMQRTTTQYPQSSSSMVNVSSGTSTTTTPTPHFSLEPPSNQNYNGSGVPMRTPEKMVGMKRPYPFSMDFPPVPTFNYKVPNFADMKTNATTSCGNGSGFNFDAGSSNFREVPSCSASNSEPYSQKSIKDNENFNGDFLTLAPPSPTSYQPSKLKSSPTFQAFHNQHHPEFPSPSFQGNVEDQIPLPPGYSRFNQQQQQQPMYSFLPPAAREAQIGQTTARVQNGDEDEEMVDLNLKL